MRSPRPLLPPSNALRASLAEVSGIGSLHRASASIVRVRIRRVLLGCLLLVLALVALFLGICVMLNPSVLNGKRDYTGELFCITVGSPLLAGAFRLFKTK